MKMDVPAEDGQVYSMAADYDYDSDNLDAFDSYEREQERYIRRYPEYYEVEKENDDLPEHLVDIEWENDFAEKDGVIDGLEIKEV